MVDNLIRFENADMNDCCLFTFDRRVGFGAVVPSQNYGDWDYNDLVFFLWVEGGATWNEVPPYEDGLIRVCNSQSGASSASLATVDCVQWALLESTSATQSCLTYMPIPAGWIWAPNDATSRAIITTLATKWAYTSAACFLLSTNATAGVGFRSNGAPCTEGEYSVSTIVNGTQICYNAKCTSRFVLKGANLGTQCTSANRCVPDVEGSILAIEPTSPVGATLFPTSTSAFLKATSGEVPVTTTLQLPGGTATTQKIDIVVLADFSTVPTNKRSAVIDSWGSVASGFNTEKLDARFAFVQYTPSGSSYGLTSEYTLTSSPAALTTSMFPSSAASCPTSNRPLYKAIADVMNTASLNWREDSFKVVWVHSSCALTETSDMATASRLTGVVPVFAFAGSSSSNALPSTGWAPSGSNRPPIFNAYKSGDTWASPFAYASSSNSYPRGAGIMRHYPTSLLAVAISGDTAFVSGLPTAINTDARTAGQSTISYKMKWPSSGYPYNAAAVYRVVLRIMGRGTVSYAINFNHVPDLPNVSYSLLGNVDQLVTLNPTDADGNTLNLMVTAYPTKGKLYDLSGAEITASNQLPAGTYQMIYRPNTYATGADSASFTVNDGCATDPGTASFTITYANTPPVAQDIVIDMLEDSIVELSNGLINFNSYISDVDITAGVVSQTLSVIMVSNPAPSTRGSLVYESDRATVVAAGNTNVPKQVRFKLNQPYSGYGTVTFSYRVSDGTNQGNALSNIATVTINIIHKNHDPILTISNTHLYAQSSAPGDVLLDGYVTDLDFLTDSMNLYVVSSTLNEFSVKVGSNVFSSTTPMPFKLYSANFTSGTSTYPVSGLYWTSTAVATQETVTFRAIDSAGGLSHVVTVTLEVTPSFPPTWADRPLNSSTSFAPLTMMQGDTLSGLRFAATDEDADQWLTLVFSLTTAPSHGVVRFLPISPGTPVDSNAFKFSAGSNSTLVSQQVSDSTSVFYLEYTPNPDFSGSDTFTFNVEDEDGKTAAEPANVIVHVARRNTRPVSADIEIHALEAAPGTGSIPVDSTNGDYPVYLQLESVDFQGSIILESTGAPWIEGTATAASLDAFVDVRATGLLGVYSASGVPTGSFNYTVHEPFSGLTSIREYTAKIFVTHVNHAPTSENQADRIKRRELLRVQLQAQDFDDDDPVSTLEARFATIAVNAKGEFFFDEACSQQLTTLTLSTRTLDERTFWYRSMDAFSTGDQPLATYTFFVEDKQGLRSTATYFGSIIVDPAGDVPQPNSLDVYTYQETPVPMVLGLGVETETGGLPIVRVVSPPAKGTFSICDDNGVCSPPSVYPATVSSSTGRVIFVPQNDDWAMNFTSFPFTLTDPGSGAVGEYTMRIHVYHVNKRPYIAATNFLTAAQSNQGIIVNESSYHVFDWRAWDTDSLPGVLTTNLRVSFYTSLGFSLYTCNYVAGHYDSPNCAFDITEVPFAVRTDFTKNARRSLDAFETVTGDCADADILKTRRGNFSDDCQAHFKLVFAPAPFAAFTPYISVSFSAADEFGEESTPISALIYVKALNTPPTIWTPANVLGGQGVTNPFLRDTDQNSETYNRPVQVADVDANGNIELLTIAVTEGSGTLIYPETVPCSVDPNNAAIWYCRDRMPSFEKWLSDLRFEVTDGDRATLRFEINDLGFSSDYKPSPNQTAESFTTVLITTQILAPKGNSSTLAIAVGVAAAVGLLLLGALGFFLRKAVQPPKDDYFSAATTPLSAAPQSPLYQAQNQTHENALYKAKS